MNPATSVFPPASGLASHDVGACEDLENALRGIAAMWRTRGNSPDVKLLVVTGDLTVCGDDSEFALALTFLRETVVDAWRSTIGLGKVDFDEVLAIPGNHDHWGGAYRFLYKSGHPPNIHGTYFPTSAGKTWWFATLGGPAGPVVQLMGLDTCAGPGARLFARGCIDPNDLAHLKHEVDRSNQAYAGRKIARVLLAHHGVAMPPTLNGYAHALDPASAQALTAFVRTCRVHRLLTGHLHTPLARTTQVLSVGEEVRSGTTLQAHAGGGQSFLLHEIDEGRGQLTFKTTVYQRTLGNGFSVAQSGPAMPI